VSGEGEQRSGVSHALVVRRTLATASSLFAAWLFVTLLKHSHLYELRWLAPAALTAGPILAAFAVWNPRVGWQLLARGIWWSLLLVGGLVSAFERHDYTGCGVALAAACSLLLAGRVDLDGARGRFQPVAFRGTLMLALVLAIADTATSLYFGIAQTVEGQIRVILLVPAMIAGIVGLLRLRTWGLLLSLACNVLVAVLAATRTLQLPDGLRPLLIATAVLQLLIPIPMWIAIVRRRVPPPDGWRRTKLVVATLVIVAIAATSVAFSLRVERLVYDY